MLFNQVISVILYECTFCLTQLIILSLFSVVMLKSKTKCRIKISYILKLGHYSLKRGKKVVSLEAFVFDLAVEYWVQCD